MRKLSIPRLSSLQGLSRDPGWEATYRCPPCSPDLAAPGVEAEERKGQRGLGRRPDGCQPGNGLTSSAGIEMMRSCNRAAGWLNPPLCAYTWRWEHVRHPVSIETVCVCDTMRIHLGRRALSVGRSCVLASLWSSRRRQVSRPWSSGLINNPSLMGIGVGREK